MNPRLAEKCNIVLIGYTLQLFSMSSFIYKLFRLSSRFPVSLSIVHKMTIQTIVNFHFFSILVLFQYRFIILVFRYVRNDLDSVRARSNHDTVVFDVLNETMESCVRDVSADGTSLLLLVRPLVVI